MKIDAVLFDFDGTLTAPGAIDFEALRQQVNCPPDTPLLEYISGLGDPPGQQRAFDILNQHEYQAATRSQPNRQALELLHWIKSQGLRMGIISRNSRQAVGRALENFPAHTAALFSVLITRDDPVAPKPDPAGVLLAARQWQIPASDILVVGDYHFDIQAGRRAGSQTAFLDNGTGYGLRNVTSHWTIRNLNELIPLIESGRPLKAGKLPLKLLRDCLEEFEITDPAVIINPGIGEDIAAVDIAGDQVLVLKSDPITFATDAVGYYAVLINANDIATSGARPRWLLTTLLFPVGTTPSQVREVMYDLQQVCRQWDISLCGGHTEITDAVVRPVVSGMMCGTVPRSGLIDKRHIQPGDRIWLTKALAIEGTSIIAREFGATRPELGLSEAELADCRNLLHQISVLPEARLAAAIEGVSGMHDVTEGGLAGALEELSMACGHRLQIHLEKIAIMPVTRRICEVLQIDPLGLIASGSLLICCRSASCQTLAETLQQAGIAASCIGEVLSSPHVGVTALEQGHPFAWPHFEVDEITRLYTGASDNRT